MSYTMRPICAIVVDTCALCCMMLAWESVRVTRGAKEARMIRLYLDDVRNPPDDGGGPWALCRTLDEAKTLLLRGVDEASLDHDLGQCEVCASDLGPNNCPHVGTGYDLVKWMAEHGIWPRLKPRVHSANPVGRAAMVQMIERHWRPR